MENDEEEVYEWKKIKDEITCSICGDIFTDPKTVPCLHTFCKVCLEKSIEMNKKLASDVLCPLCRAKLTQDNVALIPTNFVTKRLVEIYSQQEERRKSASIARQRLQSLIAKGATISGDTESTRCTCTAKYNYLPKGENELAINEGDLLYVMSSEDPDWWFVQSKHSTLVGYVPRNYVTENLNSSLQHDQILSHHPIYIAKYNFSPRRKNELGFKEGDKIYIVNTDDPDWWLGDLSGQVGYIPSNYVVEIDRNQSMCHLEEKAGLNSYPPCIANYRYSPKQASENHDNLSFIKGEVLYVISTNNSNWWLAGKMGCIPSGHVSEFKADQLHKADGGKTEKKLEAVKACNFNYPLVIAKNSYSPSRDIELGFQEGDLLYVVNANDCDWWLVGQVGYIPTNYVSLVSNANQAISINQSTSSYPLFIAKYDYSFRTNDDLKFKKGDLLHIVQDDDDGWWLARRKDSSQQGYIPSSYVKQYKSPLDAEDWYFGAITNKHDEELLFQAPNDHASFLIRDSTNSSSGYTLVSRNEISLWKRKIGKDSNGRYYMDKYNNVNESFESLSQLVQYHTTKTGNMNFKIKSPCIVPEESRTMGLSKIANKTWQIQRSSLQLCKKLDNDIFGEVCEAMWNNTTPVIVNTLNPGTITMYDFLKEATVLKQLRHRNVVQLYAVCVEEESIYVVTEPTKHGNLQDYLQQDDGQNLQLPQLISMGAQVAAGMAYLEMNSYIHGCLTAKSVFLFEHLICRIGDFGIINALSKDVSKTIPTPKLDDKWSAPEVLKLSHFSIKSDVWSFGVLLYMMVTYGRTPYPGMSSSQVQEKLQTGYRMPCPASCPGPLYDIMWDCWRQESADRLAFEALQWQLEEFFVDKDLYAAIVCAPQKMLTN